jgi:hypothetical protein
MSNADALGGGWYLKTILRDLQRYERSRISRRNTGKSRPRWRLPERLARGVADDGALRVLLDHPRWRGPLMLRKYRLALEMTLVTQRLSSEARRYRRLAPLGDEAQRMAVNVRAVKARRVKT